MGEAPPKLKLIGKGTIGRMIAVAHGSRTASARAHARLLTPFQCNGMAIMWVGNAINQYGRLSMHSTLKSVRGDWEYKCRFKSFERPKDFLDAVRMSFACLWGLTWLRRSSGSPPKLVNKQLHNRSVHPPKPPLPASAAIKARVEPFPKPSLAIYSCRCLSWVMVS
jgi:hypothetical protein